MAKHYEHDSIMKLLTILGGLIGIVTIILAFANVDAYGLYPGIVDSLNRIVVLIVGLVISVITLIAGLKPNDPFPFHWLVLFILGVLLIVFGAGIWAGVLVIIAALIGIIDDL